MFEAILYCEFDNEKGSMILYQYPKNKITNELFDTYAEFVITKTKLCNKCVSFKHENLLFIGVPQCIEGAKYERNALLFNLVLVIDTSKLKSDYSIQSFKPLAAKLAYYLRNLELESQFLYNQQTKSNLEGILENIFLDLSSHQETSILIDTAHSIHLKLIPHFEEPPKVKIFEVPIPIRNLKALLHQQRNNWDIIFSRIIPFIDGISFVKQIAIQSNVHIEIVKKSLQHLLYFQCIKMIDIFQFNNMYTINNKNIMINLFTNQELQNECINYCYCNTNNLMLENNQMITNILQIYSKLKPGIKLAEIWEKNYTICQYINPKCFITFGLLKGFIRRVYEYPILLHSPMNDGNNSVNSLNNSGVNIINNNNNGSSGSGIHNSFENNSVGSNGLMKSSDSGDLVTSNNNNNSSTSSLNENNQMPNVTITNNINNNSGVQSNNNNSSNNNNTSGLNTRVKLNTPIIQKLKKNYLFGKHCLDEICCELEISKSELLKILDTFGNNIHVFYR
ncbi:hypothetical protein ABK040_001866 [Willaertia magna]